MASGWSISRFPWDMWASSNCLKPNDLPCTPPPLQVNHTGIIIHNSLLLFQTNSHVQHHPDVSGMTRRDQRFEVIRATKVGVDLGQVLLPVAMIAPVRLQWDGGNPDSIGAKSLDVVQFLYDAPEGATAVVGEVSTGRAGILLLSKPVC